MKKKISLLWEGLITTAGFFSTLLVLSISFFLFREAYGFFGKPPVEEGYGIFLHESNSVQVISAADLKRIFGREITNWSELGGADLLIEILSLSEIESNFKEEEIGSELEHLPEIVYQFSEKRPGILGFFPRKLLDSRHRFIPIPDNHLLDILSGKDWYPSSSPIPSFGALPILMGSLLVSFGAALIALPFGLIAAIFLSEIATKQIKEVSLYLVELLAGIPSVVFGFFGLVLLVPLLQSWFSLDQGESALAGSIILAIICLPTVITLSLDALQTVPKELKESSLALGATELQTIFRIMIPYAKSGISAAFILGLGRAFGETMAVLMVTGNAAIMPTGFLAPVRTITATIAAELGEAPSGGMHFESLFVLGSILFIVTFCLNLVAGIFTVRKT